MDYLEYYGTKEAADILGLTQSTISKKCREGVFQGAEQDAKNSPWRIPKSEIEKYKKTHSKKQKNRRKII